MKAELYEIADKQGIIIVPDNVEAGDCDALAMFQVKIEKHSFFIFRSDDGQRLVLEAIKPKPICEHRDVYYKKESDNYYCAECKQGMGNAYHKVAQTLRSIACMLGWLNVPDQATLEMEIRLLKAKAHDKCN